MHKPSLKKKLLLKKKYGCFLSLCNTFLAMQRLCPNKNSLFPKKHLIFVCFYIKLSKKCSYEEECFKIKGRLSLYS